jgi:aspartate/methionine/tyrosine aminotransferase
LRYVSPRTKLIILNSPGNPTGGIIPATDLQRIAAVARQRNILVLSDEIYGGMQYEGTPASIASLPGMQDLTIVLDGLVLCHDGVALGPCSGQSHRDRAFYQADGQLGVVHGLLRQIAGVAALRGPQERQRMVAEFRWRREIIVKGMNDIHGLRCAGRRRVLRLSQHPGAAAVSAEVAARLLDEAGIACLAEQLVRTAKVT